ncbi:MAG: hypothetical protein HFE86_02725 [Clostridiales bacterium]|nr:hypothetical protein [Clostridiales bacterium]
MNPSRTKCPVCAVSNEPDALYCKRCASPIAPSSPGGERASCAAQTITGFEGASVEDAAIFVGRCAGHYIPKFIDMELRRSRAGWNWPVFLLALFFGPAALSIWFFYRKMYRPALLFLSGGLLILAANTLVSYDFNLQYFSLFIDRLHELRASAITPAVFLQFITHATPAAANGSVNYVLNTMLSTLIFAGKLAAAVFANGIYKGHVAKCVGAAREAESPAEGLRALGGVNPGCAVGVSAAVALAYLLAGAAPVLGALGIFPG